MAMITALSLARLAYGVCMLVGCKRVAAVIPAADPGGTGRRVQVVRALALRHMLQALFMFRMPARRTILLGAGVDCLHAASMLLCSGVSRRLRPVALLDGALAAGWALAGVAAAKCSRSQGSAQQLLRGH